MSAYELAQLNIGIIKGPIDGPVMAEFVANLDPINALAERTPGFLWRLKTDEGNATSIRPYPENENMAVNMSVWKDVDSLRLFVFHSEHVEISGAGASSWTSPTVVYVDSITVTGTSLTMSSFTFDTSSTVYTTPTSSGPNDVIWLNNYTGDTNVTGATLSWLGP